MKIISTVLAILVCLSWPLSGMFALGYDFTQNRGLDLTIRDAAFIGVLGGIAGPTGFLFWIRGCDKVLIEGKEEP